MSDEAKTREELETENRALRACLKAHMDRQGVHVFRAEFTLDEERGALLTVTAPALSPERELAFGRVFAEAFGALLELDGTRDEGRSIGRDDEVGGGEAVSDDAEDVRALVNEGRGMMDYAEMQAALARMAAEKNELLLWKRWTIAREMVLMARESMTLEDQQQATVWHFAITRYGSSLRYKRQEASLAMGDVQEKLSIPVAHLSGVERGREPPFDAATTRRLCALIGVDPEPLLREAEEAVRVMLELAGGVTK